MPKRSLELWLHVRVNLMPTESNTDYQKLFVGRNVKEGM